jgi:hypothetical protein
MMQMMLEGFSWQKNYGEGIKGEIGGAAPSVLGFDG